MIKINDISLNVTKDIMIHLFFFSTRRFVDTVEWLFVDSELVES